MGMGLEEEILTLPMITICLISFGASFHLYLKLRPNFTRNLIGSYISLGSQDEILEGGILLCPINTLVTLLTNFRLVPGHTVTSFAFRDSRNLGFALKLGCKAPNTTRPDIIITPSHFWFFQITEESYP